MIDEPTVDEPDHIEHIDRLVPPKIYRLTMHFHNLIYIRFFYEQIGQQPPKWVTSEMQRVQDITIEHLERENAQGGAFWKGVQHETRPKRQRGDGS